MVEWQTGGSPCYCRDCQKLSGDHPCDICEHKAPEVLPSNTDALELWGFCATQWRMTMEGPIGLDLVAVLRVAETLGIEDTPALLERMRLLESQMLTKIREEAGNNGK